MKIRVNFGLGQSKEVIWWDSVERFPTLISLNGVKFEFVFYDKDPTKTYDQIFTFVEVPTYDPNFYVDCESWEDKFGQQALLGCQCGARHTSFPFAHMFFCPQWKTWDKL